MAEELTIDPEFKSLISPLSQDEYKGLEEDLITNGYRPYKESILVWNGIIIDGHNRYEICRRHGIEYRVEEVRFQNREEAKIFIIDNQLRRRNISLFARGVLVIQKAEIMKLQEEARRKSLENLRQFRADDTGSMNSENRSAAIDTTKEIATRIGSGYETASRIKRINESELVADEIKDKLRCGELSINEVYKEFVKPKITLTQLQKIFYHYIGKCSTIEHLEEIKTWVNRYCDKRIITLKEKRNRSDSTL